MAGERRFVGPRRPTRGRDVLHRLGAASLLIGTIALWALAVGPILGLMADTVALSVTAGAAIITVAGGVLSLLLMPKLRVFRWRPTAFVAVGLLAAAIASALIAFRTQPLTRVLSNGRLEPAVITGFTGFAAATALSALTVVACAEAVTSRQAERRFVSGYVGQLSDSPHHWWDRTP